MPQSAGYYQLRSGYAEWPCQLCPPGKYSTADFSTCVSRGNRYTTLPPSALSIPRVTHAPTAVSTAKAERCMYLSIQGRGPQPSCLFGTYTLVPGMFNGRPKYQMKPASAKCAAAGVIYEYFYEPADNRWIVSSHSQGVNKRFLAVIAGGDGQNPSQTLGAWRVYRAPFGPADYVTRRSITADCAQQTSAPTISPAAAHQQSVYRSSHLQVGGQSAIRQTPSPTPFPDVIGGQAVLPQHVYTIYASAAVKRVFRCVRECPFKSGAEP